MLNSYAERPPSTTVDGMRTSSTTSPKAVRLAIIFVSYTPHHPFSAMITDKQTAFDIQAPDVPGPSSYNHFDGNGLASRPPSRTSHNKSPLGRVIDMTAEHAAGLYDLCGVCSER